MASENAGAQLLVERYIPGVDLTVSVMGDGDDDQSGLNALAVTGLLPNSGFFDYDSKYTAGMTKHVIPAEVPSSIYGQALDWAKLAHKTLGCRGVSRADFRFDSETFDTSDTSRESRALIMLEVNTQPGMTPMSLVPEQAAFCGISFTDLVTWLVERARCD
jgi:D-alanine-D-alanine ligase